MFNFILFLCKSGEAEYYFTVDKRLSVVLKVTISWFKNVTINHVLLLKLAILMRIYVLFFEKIISW